MSGVDNSQDPSEKLPAKSSVSSDKMVIGVVVLCIVALGAYQLFFCPTCYESSDRTAVHDTVEPSPAK